MLTRRLLAESFSQFLDALWFGHRRAICRLLDWLHERPGHEWTDRAVPPACRWCGQARP